MTLEPQNLTGETFQATQLAFLYPTSFNPWLDSINKIAAF